MEYSFPPLIPGNPVDSNEVPDAWKHLPSLAIPDGAHNYEKGVLQISVRIICKIGHFEVLKIQPHKQFFHVNIQIDRVQKSLYGSVSNQMNTM